GDLRRGPGDDGARGPLPRPPPHRRQPGPGRPTARHHPGDAPHQAPRPRPLGRASRPPGPRPHPLTSPDRAATALLATTSALSPGADSGTMSLDRCSPCSGPSLGPGRPTDRGIEPNVSTATPTEGHLPTPPLNIEDE